MRLKATLDFIHAACLPFTTRLLRQPRLRRHTTIAIVLTALTVLVGLWLGLGTGDAARDARRGLGFEMGTQARAVQEMHVLGDDAWHVSALEDERERIVDGTVPDGRWNSPRIESVARTAHLMALTAMSSPHRGAHSELRRQVQAVIDRNMDRGFPAESPMMWFDWRDESNRAWLKRYVETGGIPTVSRYTSPIGVTGLARLIGMLGAGVLLMLTMVVAPLWVGTVVAQEVSENTLQPLAATALTKRQLALGMLLGPLAVVGIFAAPLAILVGGLGVVTGRPLAVLGFLVLIAIAMVALSVMAQMFALQVGRKRAPGTVGVLLSAILGAALIAGLALALDTPKDAVGLMTALPEAAGVHLLRVAFAPGGGGVMGVMPLRIDLGIAVTAAGLLVFGAATLRAIERRLAEHPGPLLTAMEAVGVAIAAAFISVCVLWGGPKHGAEWTLIAMAGVTPTLLLLLMARVPGGDLPASLKVVPLTRLLGELTGWLAITIGASLLVGPEWKRSDLSVVGAVHLTWAFGVAGLAAIRLAAAPAKLWPRLFVGFALLCAWASFMMGAIAIVTGGPDLDFPLANLPGPLVALGLLIAGAVPWGLVAELSAQGVGLSADDRPTLPA